MMSAIILAERRDSGAEGVRRAVARSLSALVPMVVGDIVADATIVARSGIDFSTVEQSAGCGTESDDDLSLALMRAAKRSRRDRLLLISAGYAPEMFFADEIVQAIEKDAPNAVRIVRAEPENFLQRLAPRLAPAVAIVAPRAALIDANLRGDVTVMRLAKRLAGGPMRTRAYRV